MDGKGIYVLLLHLQSPRRVTVGALGEHTFAAGWYAYAGSAHGAGGLDARLTRHFAREKRLRWHIDYLLRAADSVSAWTAPLPGDWECEWARRLAATPGAATPVPGFGASDCRCASHLVCFATRPALDLMRLLACDGTAPERWKGSAEAYRITR